MSERNLRTVGWAAVLTGVFVLVEVAGGVISGSLALLADAGHMLTDFAALALAWVGFRVAQRPATERHTYGLDRFPVLVAFTNGLTLFAVAAWIVWEAAHRLLESGTVLAGTMFWVAVAGLAVNLVVFAMLQRADPENLNIRGAMLHVLGDLLGSAAAILAAVLIWATGWVAADPLLSVLVALLILRSAWALVRDSAHVLLQGTPSAVDTNAVAADLIAAVDGLEAVEHVHLWSLTPERPVLTLEARIADGYAPGAVSEAVRAHLRERFGVAHVTVGISPADAPAPPACG